MKTTACKTWCLTVPLGSTADSYLNRNLKETIPHTRRHMVTAGIGPYSTCTRFISCCSDSETNEAFFKDTENVLQRQFGALPFQISACRLPEEHARHCPFFGKDEC